MYEDRHELWAITPQGRMLRRSVPARRSQVEAYGWNHE